MVTDPTMVVLVSAILVGVVVIAFLIFLRFTQGSRHTGLLENIERHEREQAQEDREAGEVLRGGPRGGAVAPIGPAAPAGAAANGGAQPQPRGGPSALAQATAQRLTAVEQELAAERQRREEDDEFDPIKTRIRQASQAIKRASGLLDAALREGYAEESRLDAVREGIRKERNRIRREGREEELDHLKGLSGFRELEEIQGYPEHRAERPVQETRRPAEPTRPETPVQEASDEEPEAAPAEEPEETVDEADAVLAEARRIAGETETEEDDE